MRGGLDGALGRQDVEVEKFIGLGHLRRDCDGRGLLRNPEHVENSVNLRRPKRVKRFTSSACALTCADEASKPTGWGEGAAGPGRGGVWPSWRRAGSGSGGLPPTLRQGRTYHAPVRVRAGHPRFWAGQKVPGFRRYFRHFGPRATGMAF
jgi:hypothetical protein